MASFIADSPLSIGRKGAWLLFGPWMYRSDVIGEVIKIPANFETDLASIPRIFTPLVTKNGEHRRAAVVHDYLYAKKGKMGAYTVTRKEADQVFLEAMEVCKVKRWRRWIMYRAVRIGGWAYWNSNT